MRQRSAGQLVVLRLGDREYGLVAGAVEQVMRMVAIRPVPEAPPWIAGVVNLRELRADPRTAEVPVVVVSADATTGQADRLRGQGAREYRTKPLDVPRLLDVIRATLAS